MFTVYMYKLTQNQLLKMVYIRKLIKVKNFKNEEIFNTN